MSERVGQSASENKRQRLRRENAAAAQLSR
jgi:hypothetical protein